MGQILEITRPIDVLGMYLVSFLSFFRDRHTPFAVLGTYWGGFSALDGMTTVAGRDIEPPCMAQYLAAAAVLSIMIS